MAAGNSDITIGYGEARIQAKGLAGICGMFFIIVCAVGFYVHNQTQIERRQEHVSVMEELRVITYILSQPEGKRPVLTMPRALQERLQRSYYNQD